MRRLTVAEFKARFSEVLTAVQRGESVAVSYGKSHKPVGVFSPYRAPLRKRRLGVLKGKGSFRIHADFKMTEEQLLQ